MILLSPHIAESRFCNTLHSKVILNKHTQICANAIILPSAICGIDSVLGAYSLLKNNMDNFKIFAGIPAKKSKNEMQKILDLEKELKRFLSIANNGVGRQNFNPFS